MDPVIGLCTGVSSLCLEYIKRYKNAPAELHTMVIEVDAVKSVLGLLNARPKDDEDTTCILATLANTVAECERVLRSLEALLLVEEDHGDEDQQQKPRKIKKALNRGEWPFKREKISYILEELSRIKSTLTLGLTVDSANDLKQIRDNVRNIKENTNAAEFDRILDWLVTTDPSPIHNDACSLHEKHTGEWLINSPDWREWREGRNRILWIHGIAGAGKTNLLSHIFENVKSFCDTVALKGTGFVYYYCYFARAQNEATHILRWIISQLCRQIEGMPPELRSLWRKGTEPTIPELIDAIFQILPNFPRVYITIDALDESEQRDEFLAFIQTLFNDRRLGKISFLVTSRHERDIGEVLSEYNKGLSMSNSYVDEDIRIYVKSYISRERRMKMWPEDLKDEVIMTLVDGAGGMFRWVVCQLDSLKWLGKPHDIRSALADLPESLDETYERVLRGVPKKHQQKVARAFKMIVGAAGSSDFTVDQLAAAIAVDVETQTYSSDDHDVDKWAVVESCKCLVTVHQITGRIIFAHYTVREYLSSDRLFEKSSLRGFHLNYESIHMTFSLCCIIHILEGKPSDMDQLSFFARNWETHIKRIEENSNGKQITALVLKLLDPERPHFLPLMKLRGFSTNEGFPIWKADPSNKICVTFAYLIRFTLIDIAKHLVNQRIVTRKMCGKPIYQLYAEKYGAENPSVLSKLSKHTKDIPWELPSTPWGPVGATNILEIALRHWDWLYEDHLQLVLGLHPDPNVVSEIGYSYLSSVFIHKVEYNDDDLSYTESKLKSLFLAGARPQLPHLSVSPLQCMFVKAANLSFGRPKPNELLRSVERMFHEFIERGADVNGVGCDQANEKRIKIACEAHFSTGAWNLDQSNCPEHILKQALDSRGESNVYDTPLRLLENAIHPRNESFIKGGIKHHKDFCQALIDLLKSHGAKSLHLFPHPDLPGYCAEDMAEWQRLKDSGELEGPKLKLSVILKDFIYSVRSQRSNAHGSYWRSVFVIEQVWESFGFAKWAICIGVLLFAAMIWQTTNLLHRTKDEL